MEPARARCILHAERLRWRCNPFELVPEQARQKREPALLIGQERALDAIRLGVAIDHHGFNVFVQGPPGTGKRTAVKSVLEDYVPTRPAPSDWVYVARFSAPEIPVALRLPAGLAPAFRAEMESLVGDLIVDIPALFGSEEFRSARSAIEQEFDARQESAMTELTDKARAKNLAVLRTSSGLVLTAIRNGEVLNAEDLDALPEEEQSQIGNRISELRAEFSNVLKNAPKIEGERRRSIKRLGEDMARRVISGRIAEAMERFSGLPEVRTYLEAVEADMVSNFERFLADAGEELNGPVSNAPSNGQHSAWFRRYLVNVMASSSGERHAPLVFEPLPTVDRLTGRVEHISQKGTLKTDFTMIRPGALHRANGGYLVLEARRLLDEPMAWTALKQALENRAIITTTLAERLSLPCTNTLEPDPIPLDIRVILIGDRPAFEYLMMFDEGFADLFRIEADFEEDISRTAESQSGLLRLIMRHAAENVLLPLSIEGAAKLVDEAIRLTGDRRKISLNLGEMSSLLREAEHYAKLAGRARIAGTDIQRTTQERLRRVSRIKDNVNEAIARQLISITTRGETIGQVNGLSVVEMGNFSFGRPCKITASVGLGDGSLMDIERESELGGPIHSKGVLILGGYIRSTFAPVVPFSIQASLVFEQSYDEIEGDSASAAELVALLSAIANIPITQELAITGSVNQLGMIQAVGGINEKIEGFFETCVAQGLTGQQGVLVPADNFDNILIRDDILSAIKAGQFHLFAVKTIDDALEIMADLTAGRRDSTGSFPAESVNGLVEAQLVFLAEQRNLFASAARSNGN